MRKILLILLVLFSTCGWATKIYLSPSGNDANAGTIGSPKKTLVGAWAVVSAGDTIYLRGGTHAYDNMQYLQLRNGTSGHRINIWGYPGETAVITRSASYAVVNGVDQDLIYCEGDYLYWKDLEIANFIQKPGETAYPAMRFGFTNNSIFENLNYHDNAAGLSIRGASSNNLIYNCDFYNNKDPYSETPYDGADGVQINFCSGTNNVIRKCRAYWNADDGIDVWENLGTVTIDSCWSFFNGYIPGTFTTAGNGSGIKLGSTTGTNVNTLYRTVTNCVVWKNRSFGIVENALLGKSNIYNNTVGRTGVYGFWFGAWNASVATIKNNISYSESNDITGNAAPTFNSWQVATLTSADFQSLDSTQLYAARVSNQLPTLTFVKLVAGSDLIDAGTDVGFGNDIGAFQYTAGGNASPTANAGTDQTITLPTSSVTLTGSGNDSDGSISAYAWTKISGTGGTIVSPTSATTSVTGLTAGTYVFRLTVTDNASATGTDDITVTVNAAGQTIDGFRLRGRRYIFRTN